MKKLMAGEIEEKIATLYLIHSFLAFADIGWSLSLTRRWDLRKAALFHKQVSL